MAENGPLNGWARHQLMVLDNLERLSEAVTELNKRQKDLEVKIAVMAAKASLISVITTLLLGGVIQWIVAASKHHP